MKRSFIREILESVDCETISFAGGLPNENHFPVKDLKDANLKLYENSKNLQYAQSNGIEELRQQIAEFYNEEGFETNASNILITTGSQQALYVIAKNYQSKDIVIEEPSYLGAINTFKMNSMIISTAELNNDGVNIDKFRFAFEKTKLAYLIPDFQNPKGSLYSQEKREKIARMTLENNAYIIEDAPYTQLYFEKKPKSISSMIPNNSLHLGSFSKTLSPSLRVGWIRANEEIIKELTMIKETIDLHSCSIAQYTVSNYLNDSSKYKKHLQKLREAYKTKMEFFVKALKKHLPSFEFTKPMGGMFIYGRLKDVDTYELVQECIKEKVVFVPASQFYLDKKICDEIRFNFTHSSQEDVEIGLIKINSIYGAFKNEENLIT